MIFGTPIILAVLAFVSVIFIHELGHYLVGRLCGIGASTFSIGFGPKLISYTDRHNTQWMICLIPLGGFVKFQTNDENSKKELINYDKKTYLLTLKPKKLSFEDASLMARALTVLAGPVANFLMSAMIFALVAQAVGVMSDEPTVGEVATLPSEQVSLMAGDRILNVEGEII